MFEGAGLVDSWVEADEASLSPRGRATISTTSRRGWTTWWTSSCMERPTRSRPSMVRPIGGEELDDRTATELLLWPSDHAGVVVTLHTVAA